MDARQKLKRWMQLNKLRQHQLAKQVGVRQPTVHKWLAGAMRPDWVKVRRIQDVTNGFVRADDWLPASENETVEP